MRLVFRSSRWFETALDRGFRGFIGFYRVFMLSFRGLLAVLTMMISVIVLLPLVLGRLFMVREPVYIIHAANPKP